MKITDDIKKQIIHAYTYTLKTVDEIATEHKTGRREVVGIVQYARVFDTNRQKRVECNRLIRKIETDNRFKLDDRVQKKLDEMKRAFKRWENEETDYFPLRSARAQLNYAVGRLDKITARSKKSNKIAIVQKYGVRICDQISTKTDNELEKTIGYYKSILEKTYSSNFPQEDLNTVRAYCEEKIMGCDNVLSGNLTDEDLNAGIIERVTAEAEKQAGKAGSEVDMAWIKSESARRIAEFNGESEKAGWGSDHLRPGKGGTGHDGPVSYRAPFVDRTEEALSY